VSHSVKALPIAAWAPSTSYPGFTVITPSPPNGYLYAQFSPTGNSGTTQPIWPTTVGAEVADAGLTWYCLETEIGYLLTFWDDEQVSTVNGDLGGCWAPKDSAITFTVTGGGYVQVNGPTQLTNGGELLIESGAYLELGTGDFPRNGPTHRGRNRRYVTSTMVAKANSLIGLRPDFSLNAMDAVACALQYYVSVGDSIVTVTTVPVQWQLPLDVHDGANFVGAVLSYRANLGTPKARVIAVSSSTGVITPLTSTALGADVNGYVTAPAADTSATVQTWTIPIDGGVAGGSVVVARDSYLYLLQVVEDQTQTTYPGTLPVLTQVAYATTGPIDMANAPTAIDGFSPSVDARILVNNQFNPAENGIYLYPGAGNPFPLASGTPVPQWQASTGYTSGVSLVQPVGPSPGIGLYFKCTASTGATGSTQPVWPLVTGATVTDGGVTWTCEGSLPSYTYRPVIELRTYGLLQGSIVQVIGGTTLAATWWQYAGATISTTGLGATPAIGWVTIPFGLTSGANDTTQTGTGVFSAAGNAYHSVVCNFANITTQRFQ
jgi:hypothetical protein